MMEMERLDEMRPPEWPLKVMKRLIRKEYIEEIEGDMEELFYDNAELFTLRKAKWIYCREMFLLLRPTLVNHLRIIQTLNQRAMFKNYFKVSIRGLMKNPLNSFINIVGLSVAIGISIFVYAFAHWTYSTDQFHENKNEVFLVTFFADRDGSAKQFGRTPRPLGEMLRQDFAHIEKVCRVEDRQVVVKHQDNVFHERIRFTDPEFLDMFTFPLKWGEARSLADVNSIILSEKMAIKYFGDQNPVGQTMMVKFGADIKKEFKIAGVAQKFPEALTIRFDFLINFENFRVAEPDYNFHDWNAFVNATLIQVDDASSIGSVQHHMEKYRSIQNKAVQKDWAISSFGFEPLATLHERSGDIRDGISFSSESNYQSVVYLSFIGVFMLLLACFNYINIAIVSAAKRLKEIGVRKSIGATRKVVIVQFLSENMVVMAFALLLGLALSAFVIIPWFEGMWSFRMGFSILDKNLWIYLPIVLFATGVLSGIYPSLYISKFQVVSILKGSLKFGQKNPLTKVFLTAQLILACVFITSAVMFTQNSEYLANRSWGYGKQDVLYVEVADEFAFDEFNNVMIQESDVLSTAGSSEHLGKRNTAAVLHLPERDYEADQIGVDAQYFETMGLQLKEGRLFNKSEGSDKNAVVINELLARNLGGTTAVGQEFEMDSARFEVVGVVKDFHHNSFETYMRPMLFRVADKKDYRYLSLRVRPGSKMETYSTMQAKWAKLFPEIPFQGGHQEDVWGGYYEEIGIHGKVWRAFAFIAVLLAVLGVYGLVTLNVASRVREFSIRKVLGARTTNIAANVSNQYLTLFAIALIIGAPVSYTLIKLLFDSAYKYHMPVTYAGVLLAMFILVSALAITLATQIRKVTKASPVNGLKTE